jgi:hypothetical protein
MKSAFDIWELSQCQIISQHLLLLLEMDKEAER